ncbi:kinase interacting-like protein [Corchorus olitorius]|uniref:Kinase interacting-like protein n=1 Tax=Corchorus olitorius TaxID=93759 RepID=A0A1R3KVE3_9ROSI|nr:kinase interacting-like protein [Corchorus olitorius]
MIFTSGICSDELLFSGLSILSSFLSILSSFMGSEILISTPSNRGPAKTGKRTIRLKLLTGILPFLLGLESVYRQVHGRAQYTVELYAGFEGDEYPSYGYAASLSLGEGAISIPILRPMTFKRRLSLPSQVERIGLAEPIE